jgi:outer membrane immunogenic protein
MLAVTGTTFGADLPARDIRFAAPAFSWTGFYIGAHAGYSWANSDATLASVYPGGVLEIDLRNRTLPAHAAVEGDGPTGGVQVGYNVQLGAVVGGLEADISFMDAKGRGAYSAPDLFLFPGVPTHSIFHSQLDALGTFRARVGFVVDRALFYATGGLAVGEVDNGFSVDTVGYYANSWSHSRTEWGWTAGGGIEYALWNGLSLKAEYLYYDLGERTIRYTDPPVFGAEYIDYKFKHEGSIARAGVNYRF